MYRGSHQGGGNTSLNLNDHTTHSSDTGVSIQKLKELNSEGAWQAPKTLQHGLQRQYDRELVTNIYVQN